MTGEQLKHARELLGLSRDDLADCFGLHYTSIQKWETNGSSEEELKSWVPLALAGLSPGSFKIFNGEIFTRLGVTYGKPNNKQDSESSQEGSKSESSS